MSAPETMNMGDVVESVRLGPAEGDLVSSVPKELTLEWRLER